MLSLLAYSLFATAVSAATPVSDANMNDLLNQGGVNLALQAQPMWLIGQSLNQPPAYPTFATTPDGKQVPSAPLCDWPDVGCSARNPGVGIGNPGPSFPVYYSYQKCNATSIRVAYNLFYQKDGVNPSGIFGHPYDWERVIVIWAQGSDTNWTPSQVLLSQHSGYQRINWADVQNSFPTSSAGQARGGPDGIKNQDHLKVYIASYKHDHHQERNTGFNDALSQLTDNAFRSNDWWYFPTAADYIRADRSTAIGQLIASFNWGDASSNPASVNDGLCSA